MKLIKSPDVKNTTQMQLQETVNGVSFLNKQQCDTLLEATNNNIETIKKWFSIIGIEYTDIELSGITVSYCINNEWLSLADLSSGERLILYIMACKELNRKLIVWGLFERLGSRLERIALQQFKDYENLTVVVCNAILPREYKQYFIKELE